MGFEAISQREELTRSIKEVLEKQAESDQGLTLEKMNEQYWNKMKIAAGCAGATTFACLGSAVAAWLATH